MLWFYPIDIRIPQTRPQPSPLDQTPPENPCRKRTQSFQTPQQRDTTRGEADPRQPTLSIQAPDPKISVSRIHDRSYAQAFKNEIDRNSNQKAKVPTTKGKSRVK